MTQITSGTGPDLSPMRDPAGKGIYFVNGKSSGISTAYNLRSKQSTDIAAENATQPVVSGDGKRISYITTPSNDRSEVWTANIDGSNKMKITTAKSIATGDWAPDNFHLYFMQEEPNRIFIAGADGSGVHEIPWNGGVTQNVVPSPDQKYIYVNSYDQGASRATIWRANADGSNLELLTNECGHMWEAVPGGQYLLTFMGPGRGIGEFSLADKKCIALLPGVVSFGITLASDGKSSSYGDPVALRRHDLSPALARRKTHRPHASGRKASVRLSSSCRRQRLRFFQRSRDGRLRAPSRPSRPLSSEPKINPRRRKQNSTGPLSPHKRVTNG